MVDLSKVSQAVKDFVNEVKASEGNKRKIDTQAECNQLGAYLAGNADKMNVDEKELLQGLMVEYSNAAFEAEVTDSTKDAVKDAAKFVLDRKTIDSPVEAEHLVRILRTEELKPADAEYITRALIDAGYGDLIPDRVAELEQRMKLNESLDVAQGRAIVQNAVDNELQDIELARISKENEEQSEAIALYDEVTSILDKDITRLQGQVATQGARIDNLAGQVTEQTEDIDNLAGQVTEQAEDIDKLAGQVTEQAEDIDKLKEGEHIHDREITELVNDSRDNSVPSSDGLPPSLRNFFGQ